MTEMDDYEVLELLGEGSSGEAFLVQAKDTGIRHVLKRIRTDFLSAPEREAAEREAVVLKSFDHPNITKFECSFISPVDGSVNIVMEPCEMTLDHLIEAMRTDEQEMSLATGKAAAIGFPDHVLLEWMAEMASALQYLHARRVVHRDIKPSNIFVSRTNHLKLGDFGVCKVLSRRSMVANSVVGTPWYIAPEVLNEEPYDERSDVWSLGVVFFELCTLQRPFNGDNFISVANEVTSKEVPRVSKMRSIDSRFDDVIVSMLQKDPRKRAKADDVLKRFVVQSNHPSHPSQDPHRSRICQDTYKIDLTLPKSLTREKLAAAQEAASNKGPSRPRSTSPIVCETAVPSSVVKMGKPNPPGAAAAAASAKKPAGPHGLHGSSAKKPGGQATTKQDDHTRRVRQARSKINMQELRQRWGASQTASEAGDCAVVLIPRHPSSPESASRERHADPSPPQNAPQADDSSEPPVPDAKPRPLSATSLTVTAADGSLKAFLCDLLRQLGDGRLTLEEVDEAELALLEFKKAAFGTY